MIHIPFQKRKGLFMDYKAWVLWGCLDIFSMDLLNGHFY